MKTCTVVAFGGGVLELLVGVRGAYVLLHMQCPLSPYFAIGVALLAGTCAGILFTMGAYHLLNHKENQNG